MDTAKPDDNTTVSTGGRFSRQQRLCDAAAYDRVFKKAERSRDKYFTVLYRDNGSDSARLGLAISRKKCPRAVQRNRIKRLVRETFRLAQAGLGGVDIVVLNGPTTHLSGNKRLIESLNNHWARCGADGNSKNG